MTRLALLLFFMLGLLLGIGAGAPSLALDEVAGTATGREATEGPPSAPHIGRTMFRSDKPLLLRANAESQGGAVGPLSADVAWTIDGKAVSRSPELVMSLGSVGQRRMRLHYRDDRRDSLSDVINVQVMEPGDFEAMTAAIQAAAHLPLWMEDEVLFLPAMTR